MKISSAARFPVEVKIINNYIAVRSNDFDFTVVGGSLFHAEGLESQIGRAVLDSFKKIERRVAAGLAPITHQEPTVPLIEAGRRLGISSSSVRRLATRGKLEYLRTDLGHRRILVRSLNAYLKRTH